MILALTVFVFCLQVRYELVVMLHRCGNATAKKQTKMLISCRLNDALQAYEVKRALFFIQHMDSWKGGAMAYHTSAFIQSLLMPKTKDSHLISHILNLPFLLHFGHGIQFCLQCASVVTSNLHKIVCPTSTASFQNSSLPKARKNLKVTKMKIKPIFS